jgi:hypothetical protein
MEVGLVSRTELEARGSIADDSTGVWSREGRRRSHAADLRSAVGADERAVVQAAGHLAAAAAVAAAAAAVVLEPHDADLVVAAVAHRAAAAGAAADGVLRRGGGPGAHAGADRGASWQESD